MTNIDSRKRKLYMTNSRDFSVPDEFSDVVLLVEGQKLHVNRILLSSVSPVFKAMLTKDFAEGKQAEIKLKGPADTEMKYDQFHQLLKTIHPPYEEINDTNIEYLLELAHYFDVDIVFRLTDLFLAHEDRDHQRIPAIKKVLMADKYSDKLVKTKDIVIPAFREANLVRELMKKEEFATMSEGMKVELFQVVMSNNVFVNEFFNKVDCEYCSRYIFIPKNHQYDYCPYCGY